MKFNSLTLRLGSCLKLNRPIGGRFFQCDERRGVVAIRFLGGRHSASVDKIARLKDRLEVVDCLAIDVEREAVFLGVRLAARYNDHAAPVGRVTYNPAGTRLVSACHDGTLTIWDSETFKEILVLRGHDEVPRALAFSVDGQTLFSGGNRRQVHVWDGSPWDPMLERVPVVLGTFDAPIINALAVKPDGSELAAGGEDGVVKIFRLPRGDFLLPPPSAKAFEKHGKYGNVFDLAYESSGPDLISIGQDVKRWNTATGDEAFSSVKSRRGGFSLAIAPLGDRFVVGGSEGHIDVYETSKGTEIGRLGSHERPIQDLVFSPDGRYLASATDEREIKLWDAQHLNTPQEVDAILQCQGGSTLQMGFDRQGLHLALGDGSDVLIYDVAAPEKSVRLNEHGHGDSVNAAAFSHDDRFLASGSSDGTVKLWNAKTHALIDTLLVGHEIWKIAFTPGDAWLATAGHDAQVRLWDLSFLSMADDAATSP